MGDRCTRTRKVNLDLGFFALLVAMAGCGSEDGTPASVGGAAAPGSTEVTAAGGIADSTVDETAVTASGGTANSATGGTTVTASGGTTNSATGGATVNAAGGSADSATGGLSETAAGGTQAAGAGGDATSTGGDGATTGTDATGGTAGSATGDGGADATGGAGEEAAGGTSGDAAGGSGGDPVDPTPTSGCDAESWPANPTERVSINVDGAQREYVFTVPDGYDATTPMRLIFVWHGLNGTIDSMNNQFFSYFGMGQAVDDNTILAAGQGLPSEAGGTDYAWRNTDGEDVALVRALIDWFGSNFCIDAERMFSTGMSYGGVMSNEVGCYLGDVIRAIAPIAGAGPGFGSFGSEPACVGQVASLLIHGTADETVTFDMGEASRDHWIEANGCSTDSAAVAPTEYCVAYSGCDASYPVHWCVHDGGHIIPDWSAETIWDFFQQF